MWAFLIIYCACVIISVCSAKLPPYNETQGIISLHLSAAAFCDDISNTKYAAPLEDLVVTRIIDDVKSDCNGYISYLPSDSSIYVTYRGSGSARNWISDFDVRKTNYTSYPECECQVSDGFYRAEQSVFGIVLGEVQRLLRIFPTYAVKVTGHSYGAAIAQLTSMDLLRHGIESSVYNYGQPRTGDAAYSAFVGDKISTYRVVHNRDIVPHWPFDDRMGYYHVCREEFESEDGSLRTCNESCEDPMCSDQYAPHEWRPDDHMTYLGMYISCDSVRA